MKLFVNMNESIPTNRSKSKRTRILMWVAFFMYWVMALTGIMFVIEGNAGAAFGFGLLTSFFGMIWSEYLRR